MAEHHGRSAESDGRGVRPVRRQTLEHMQARTPALPACIGVAGRRTGEEKRGSKNKREVRVLHPTAAKIKANSTEPEIEKFRVKPMT
jgi:hypothetical protein